jgi:hypothetical protein
MKTQALKGGDTGPEARRRDSLCPACSTPVRSGMLRLYERGEFYHAYCRSRQLARAALHENDGGKAPQAGVAGVRGGDDTPSSDGRAPRECPICQQAAIVLDGFAGMGWYAVDGCGCGGFFVAAETLEWRLPRLTTPERADLVTTIQGFRAMGRDAWLSTADGSLSGRLVVRVERPAEAS